MTETKESKTSSPYNRIYPDWFDGKHLNEVLFCSEFLRDHPMKSINGAFFTTEGRITDENKLRKEVYDRIKPYFTQGVTKRVTALIDTMRMECYSPDLPLHHDRIHVKNGTLFLDGNFTPDKDYCRNRLPVSYNPNAPKPEKWLRFLSELLESDDILTLQEFMGYCFIPSTKGQKMLLLIGKGGEGKSRIGLVLRSLLGANMNTGSISKVETSPFARADLEHELLLLDDDMKLEALPQTNNIKAIITAELPMDLERKGQQSYQGDLYVRFIGLGNGTLQSLYDRSVGFFRRQIILTTKDKPADRIDDPYIAEKMCAEAEGIFLWAIEGLHRLMANSYRFTVSRRAEENMEAAIRDGNNIVEFLSSEGYIRFKADYEITSRELYAIYRQWCEDNAATALSSKSFAAYLIGHQSDYRLEYSNRVNAKGRFVRGFVGIEPLIIVTA